MDTEMLDRSVNLIAQGQSSEAAKLFIGEIEANPKYAAEVVSLCSTLCASGQSRDAIDILESIYQSYPENFDIAGLLRKAKGEAFQLENKRVALVNPWNNKFNEIYIRHFMKKNEVRLINPKQLEDLKNAQNWADVIFSLWCNEPLIHLSQEKSRAVLVTHLHSYEMLTPQIMQNVQWRNVDGVIFVADHIREIANRMWKEQLAGVSQTTIYNSVDFDDYPEYIKQSGKNIAFIGYINHKKGVGLLLQCLAAAVKRDPEYRLHVAGVYQETRFEVYMKHLVHQMGLDDCVVMHGWVDNIPNWLNKMQYVVSTSPWEGCPLNLIEAMACGVKPLIHNWKGAASLFPRELIFNTVDQFVDLLFEDRYDSHKYRSYAETHFNAKRNVTEIDRYLGMAIDVRNKKRCKAKSNAKQESFNGSKSAILQKSSASPNRKDDKETNPPTINFYQPLMRKMEISSNRKSFTIDFCKGKRVLHIGCVDAGIMKSQIEKNNFLHYEIDKVAKKLIGADIEDDGLRYLKGQGFDVCRLDLETDHELLRKLSKEVDVIVIPEVIEHIGNVGVALENLKSCKFSGDILISTPNAFSLRIIKMISNFVEVVHPDHNYYFSPTTLNNIMSKNGFEIQRLVMYYWPSADEVGKEMQKVVNICPYYAEGMIAIVRDRDVIESKP